MRKGKGSGDGGGGDSWMNTYADMVTLLMTFFVVMLSMSTTNADKFNAFIESFSNLPPEEVAQIIEANGGEAEGMNPAAQEDMVDLYTALQEYVEENPEASGIDVSKVDDVIYIRFDSALFFTPDRSTLLQTSIPTLTTVGEALKEFESGIQMVNVVGHTADVDNSGQVSSWMLSSERAAVVARFLDEEAGFDPKKLMSVGYGKHYPIGDNETVEGRQLNRRVELVVVGADSDVGSSVNDTLASVYEQDEIIAAPGQEPFLPAASPEIPANADESGATLPAGEVDLETSPFDA